VTTEIGTGKPVRIRFCASLVGLNKTFKIRKILILNHIVFNTKNARYVVSSAGSAAVGFLVYGRKYMLYAWRCTRNTWFIHPIHSFVHSLSHNITDRSISIKRERESCGTVDAGGVESLLIQSFSDASYEWKYSLCSSCGHLDKAWNDQKLDNNIGDY